MDFAPLIAVGIPRPFVLAVVYRQMHPSGSPDLREAACFVAVNRRIGLRCRFHQWLHRHLLRILDHCQADLPALATYNSDNRCAIIVHRAAALALISSPPRWVAPLGVHLALLAGVLEHLVDLDRPISEWLSTACHQGMSLQAVPPGQQGAVVTTQFVSQEPGRQTLHNTAQKQD
jgi:hypothetical protein